MAIISRVPDFIVSIVVNQELAQEYPVPSDVQECASNPPSTTCYVESKSGQNFLVRLNIVPWREISNENGILFRVLVDGATVETRVIHHRRFPGAFAQDITGVLVAGSSPGECIRRFLTFSPVSTVEDASPGEIRRDARSTRSLGTIQVHVIACVVGESIPFPPKMPQSNSELVFAEKAMKGRELSHGTTFTHETLVPNPGSKKIHKETLLGVYNFRYRSRDALQKKMIIPRTPPPPRQFPLLSDLDYMSEYGLRLFAQVLLGMKQEDEVKQEEEMKLEAGSLNSMRPSDPTLLPSDLDSMSEADIRLLVEKMPRTKEENEAKQETEIKQEEEIKQEAEASDFDRTSNLTDDDFIEMPGNRRVKIEKLEDGTDMLDLTE